MEHYYCIISTAEDAVADLCVLDAHDDEIAMAGGREFAETVAGWQRVGVFAGERLIGLISRSVASPGLPLAA